MKKHPVGSVSLWKESWSWKTCVHMLAQCSVSCTLHKGSCLKLPEHSFYSPCSLESPLLSWNCEVIKGCWIWAEFIECLQCVSTAKTSLQEYTMSHRVPRTKYAYNRYVRISCRFIICFSLSNYGALCAWSFSLYSKKDLHPLIFKKYNIH